MALWRVKKGLFFFMGTRISFFPDFYKYCYHPNSVKIVVPRQIRSFVHPYLRDFRSPFKSSFTGRSQRVHSLAIMQACLEGAAAVNISQRPKLGNSTLD